MPEKQTIVCMFLLTTRQFFSIEIFENAKGVVSEKNVAHTFVYENPRGLNKKSKR